MRNRFHVVGVLFSICICIMAAGCGGGGGNNGLDESGTDRLTSDDLRFNSGHYVDLRSFTAKKNGYIAVEMMKSNSNSVTDPSVRVVRNICLTPAEYNSSFLAYGYLATDDDNGSGVNARALFYATEGQNFTVAFTTYLASDLGTYNWHVYETNSSSSSTACTNDTSAKKSLPEVKDGELIK